MKLASVYVCIKKKSMEKDKTRTYLFRLSVAIKTFVVSILFDAIIVYSLSVSCVFSDLYRYSLFLNDVLWLALYLMRGRSPVRFPLLFLIWFA